MHCHDLANELLDYAATGDREGYRAARDSMSAEALAESQDAENLARMQIGMWRDGRYFAWRVDHTSRRGDEQ